MLTKELISRIFTGIPTLETERLILRRIKRSDAHDMFDYSRRPDVTRYLLWSPHENEDFTAHYIAYLQKRYRLGDFYDWAIVLRASDRMVGTCGFTSFDTGNAVGEIGYVLHPDFQGQGLATEAVNRILAFGFSKLRLHRIEARYMIENEASRHVMERCGMRFEGIARESIFVKGAYHDVGICAVLETDSVDSEQE